MLFVLNKFFPICPLHTAEDTPKAARRVLPAVYVVASEM